MAGSCPQEPRTSTRTATVERVADPSGVRLVAVWEEEWRTNLMEAAINWGKRNVYAKQFQIFRSELPPSNASPTLRECGWWRSGRRSGGRTSWKLLLIGSKEPSTQNSSRYSIFMSSKDGAFRE